MNPNRAAFLVLVDKYQIQTRQSRISLSELHSLAYLLHVAEQPLRLEFEQGSHGPFASNLDVVLSNMLREQVLEGYDGGKGKIKLEPTAVTRGHELLSGDNESLLRIESVSSILDDCIGPLGLHSLAIVVWLVRANKLLSRECVLAKAREWNRKAFQFERDHILPAFNKLVARGWVETNARRLPNKVQRFGPLPVGTLAVASTGNSTESARQSSRTPVSASFRPEQRELLGFVLFYDPKKDYGKIQLKDMQTLKFDRASFDGLIKTESFVVILQSRGNFASSVRPRVDMRLLVSNVLDSGATRGWRIKCLNHALRETKHQLLRALLLVHAELAGLANAVDVVQLVATEFLRGGAETRDVLEAPLIALCSRVSAKKLGSLLPDELLQQPSFYKLLPSGERFRYEVPHLEPMEAAAAYFDMPERMRPEVQRYLPVDVMVIPEVFETLAPPFQRKAVRMASLSQVKLLRATLDADLLRILEKRLPKVPEKATPVYRGSRTPSSQADRLSVPKNVPNRLALTGNWDRGWALGHYSELVDLVRGFKYYNDKEQVGRLVEFAAYLCSREFPRAEFIIPIPPTQQAREYQPVTTFAERLSLVTGLPVLHALRKSRLTERQKDQDGLPAKIANLKGAFELVQSVDGKRVLLVDDIFDSGVTLFEATHTLDGGNVRGVDVLTIVALRPSQLSSAAFAHLRGGGSRPSHLMDAMEEFL